MRLIGGQLFVKYTNRSHYSKVKEIELQIQIKELELNNFKIANRKLEEKLTKVTQERDEAIANLNDLVLAIKNNFYLDANS